MRLEKRQLVDLKPAAYNPRKALKPGDDEYEKLAASIERHGLYRSHSNKRGRDHHRRPPAPDRYDGLRLHGGGGHYS